MSNYKSYFLKSLGLKEDLMAGGKGDELSPSQIDQEELEKGIKVEMEHTHDADLAKEIAMDHLAEDPHYYSHLKQAGMADELSDGEIPKATPEKPAIPQLTNLISPTARGLMPVIAIGVRGTKTGLLPAGGIVDDPEKARLGGFELVKNLKPNSQGTIANTPSSDQIKADGGHFTPDNEKITKGAGPEISIKGDATEHPMQVQKLGNKPFEDDGTTRRGDDIPSAAGGGGPVDLETQPEAEKELKKCPWGIEMDDEEDKKEGEGEGEGEDVSIDIKEGEIPKGWKVRDVKYFNPKTKQTTDAQWLSKEKPKTTDKPVEMKEAETGSEVIDWDTLVELCNASTFDTFAGRMDIWSLAGLEGLSMKDMENQTPKMFEFILKHANEALSQARSRGENLLLPDIDTLKQQWKASRQSTKIRKDTVPRNCKVCGAKFTPKGGEGICPSCVTPSKNDDTFPEQLKERFMKLANVKECSTCGCDDPKDSHGLNKIPQTNEAGALSELREVVDRLNAKGKVTPLLKKAQAYLAKKQSK